MSIMSAFTNMFSPAAPTAIPATPTGQQTAPNTPGSIPAAAPNTGSTTAGAAPNGVLPGNESSNAAEATPFADFQDLWQPPKSSEGGTPQGIFGEVDPKKFMEAAGKIDFSKVITPANMQAIAAGGEDAVKAFAQAMNQVAQTTYAQSAFAATKIAEQAVTRARESFVSELPQHIKAETLSSNLKAENPIFSNPAVAPVIDALKSQLTIKYPNATSADLTKMAKTYVENMSKAFAPAQSAPASSGKPQAESQDWEAYMLGSGV